MQAGADKVLASPVEMLGNTGNSSFPTLQPVDALPAGYTDLWNFESSSDLGSSDVSHAYMYEMGYPSHKVNNRDNKLAFWNGGADSGSTLQIYFAKTTTGIDFITTDKADSAVYDLTGRRVNATEKGVYIVGGKKVLVK